MKLLIKKHSKVVLFTGMLLFSCEAFSASEATKKLINETLAKYGISAGGKLDCNTDKEPYYDKKTGKVDCYNNGYYKQNCWDKESRLCKECPPGTLVNKRNYSYCNRIICPDGFMLIKVQDKNSCPNGFIAKKIISSDSCPSYTFSYDEITATITGLLFTNVVKSQEFYTCVPKEDWVKNVSKSLQRSDEEIRNLARQVNGIKCGFYDIYKDKNILQGKSMLLDRKIGSGIVLYPIYLCPYIYALMD